MLFLEILKYFSIMHVDLLIYSSMSLSKLNLEILPEENFTDHQISVFPLKNLNNLKNSENVSIDQSGNSVIGIFLPEIDPDYDPSAGDEESLESIIRTIIEIENTTSRNLMKYYFIFVNQDANFTSKKQLPFDRNIFLITLNQNEEFPQITEIYSSNSIYAAKNVKQNQSEVLSKSSRRDFQNITIKAIVQENTSSGIMLENRKNEISLVGGFEVEQIQFLSKALNFKISAINGTGRENFNSDETDNATGIAKEIFSRAVDISISTHELLYGRSKWVKFLHPTHYSKLFGYLVQPPSSYVRDIFVQAFTFDLWATMFVTWLLVIFSMVSLAWIKKRYSELSETDEQIATSEVIIWSTGAACQQGWHIYPESTSMKIIFLFGLITGLICYVAYSAALVYLLSTRVIPIKNLGQAAYFNFEVYCDTKAHTAGFFARHYKSPKDVKYEEIESVIGRVYNSLSVFLSTAEYFYPPVLKSFNETKICEKISTISLSRTPLLSAMFMDKLSPYSEFFNYKILVMIERGIRHHLMSNYITNSAVRCVEKSEGHKESLGLGDVATAFYIFISGHGLSLVILFTERFLYSMQMKSYITY